MQDIFISKIESKFKKATVGKEKPAASQGAMAPHRVPCRPYFMPPASLALKKKRVTAQLKKQWKDPVYRSKMSEISHLNNIKRWKDPTYRKRMVEHCRKMNHENWKISGEKRNSLIQAAKNQWKNPTYRESKVQEAKKQWRNPNYRKCMAEAQLKLLKQCRKGPNKFETRVQTFLNTSSRVKFIFVGAGPDAILINNYSPDFINQRNKIIVLACGIYWHLEKYSIEVNNKNKHTHEKIKSAPFKEAGYNVRFIWEDEFNKGIYNGKRFIA